MKVVNLAEAKAHLSELVDAAVAGKVVIIGRRNKPVVRLEPVSAALPHGGFGLLRGQIELSSDFDAPLEHFRAYRR